MIILISLAVIAACIARIYYIEVVLPIKKELEENHIDDLTIDDLIN